MPYELQGPALTVALLVVLAMLVKYERRLRRWLMRSPRHRRRAFRQPVLF